MDWNLFRSGVTWLKKPNEEVIFSPEASEALKEHLRAVAQHERLRMLTKQELREKWGRLNTHLMKNTMKTGASLPGMVVRWFENDLRSLGRLGVPSAAAQACGEKADQERREREREDRIAACKHEMQQASVPHMLVCLKCSHSEPKPKEGG